MPTRYALGRHQHHDPRSARPRYAVAELPSSALVSVDWTRRAPIFDQADLGSCEGNAWAGLYCTDAADFVGQASVTANGSTTPVDEVFAVHVYSLATTLDSVPGQYPPTDTGSDAIGGAKAMQSLGLLASYSHAFSVGAMQTALQHGPVTLGTVWYESMFDVDSSGFVIVQKASGVAGGHQYVISAWDKVARKYRIDQSWGTGWGLHGTAWFHEADITALLKAGGDVTAPTWVTTPAPGPVPVPPAVVDDAAHWANSKAWAAAKGLV